MKRNDGLRLPIFINGKSAAVQVRDQMILVVLYRRVQQHFVDIVLEYEDSLVVGILLLTSRLGLRGRVLARCRIRGFRLAGGRRRRRLRRQQKLRAGQKNDYKNTKSSDSAIRQARNIPSWHTHVEAAILSVAV